MREVLQTIFLKLDTPSNTLTQTALCQMVLQTLFRAQHAMTEGEVTVGIAELLGVDIHSDRVAEALDLLMAHGELARGKHEGKLRLAPRIKREMQGKSQEYDCRVASVISRHFADAEAEETAIRQWFEAVTVGFFHRKCDAWISEFCSSSTNSHSYLNGLPDVFRETARKCDVVDSKDEEWLRRRYVAFLESTNPDDNALLLQFATSAFAARLITSTSFADQLSVTTFKGAKFVLDTNILMSLALEEPDLADGLDALSTALELLGAECGYFHITHDEFHNAMGARRDQVCGAVAEYEWAVIEKVMDQFMQTAICEDCRTPEDFDAFFQKKLEPPTTLCNRVGLPQLDDMELHAAIQRGQQNDKLIKEINAVFHSKFGHDKSEATLTHDAGLVAGVRFLRGRGENSWLLTKDTTLTRHAVQQAPRDECPLALSVNTLVNVLALDNGGLELDPTEFAPLFARMVRGGLMPQDGAFQIEDLSRILDVNRQIADLPLETVTELATQVNSQRLARVPDSEIALNLTRAFQKEKLRLTGDLAETRQQLSDQRAAAAQATTRVIGLQRALQTQLTREYDKQFRFEHTLAIVRAACAIAGGAAAFFLASWFLTGTRELGGRASFAIGILSSALGSILACKWVWSPKLLESRETREERVRQEVAKRMSDADLADENAVVIEISP